MNPKPALVAGFFVRGRMGGLSSHVCEGAIIKSYVLEGVSSAKEAELALSALLPGQASPWLLLATENDPIAYLSIVESECGFTCPAITADMSGRHYNEDSTVTKLLDNLKERLGGEIGYYP